MKRKTIFMENLLRQTNRTRSGYGLSILFMLTFFLGTVQGWGQTTYYFVGNTTSQRIDNANNAAWSTSLGGSATTITVSTNNIFIIDGSDIGSASGLQTGTVNLTMQAAAFMGQLIIRNNANVVINGNNATTTNTLTI